MNRLLHDGSQTSAESSWYFSAPYEAPMVRRGDPLGLRFAATRFAEVLAPGLSNRTIDARWLTICAWMLVMSNDVWRRSGRSAAFGISRNTAREIYSWIAPLELLWVARTLRLRSEDKDGRQLPGQQAVGKWLDRDKKGERFGMSPAQYRRQRFTGVYGAYRVALRSLPGLTVSGDGWQADAVSEELAAVVQSALGRARALPTRAHGNFEPERYWRAEGWESWEVAGADRDYFPESLKSLRRLGADEISIIRPLLFGERKPSVEARLRASVVNAMHRSGANSHHTMCRDLERSLARDTQGALAGLGAFSYLADSGMAVMNQIWTCLNRSVAVQSPAVHVDTLLADDVLRDGLRELVRAGKGWQSKKAAFSPDWRLADELADLASSRERDLDRLALGLVQFHELHAGGRRWFRLDESGLVRPASALRDQEGSPYRFRLFSLARLAHQCGVVPRMPKALALDSKSENGKDEEGGE